jgi:hypothetical protein
MPVHVHVPAGSDRTVRLILDIEALEQNRASRADVRPLAASFALALREEQKHTTRRPSFASAEKRHSEDASRAVWRAGRKTVVGAASALREKQK